MATNTVLLQARLAEAEAAFHSLMLGGGVKRVKDQNGEEVEYSTSNRNQLASYIESLKRQLGLITTGPLSPYF